MEDWRSFSGGAVMRLSIYAIIAWMRAALIEQLINWLHAEAHLARPNGWLGTPEATTSPSAHHRLATRSADAANPAGRRQPGPLIARSRQPGSDSPRQRAIPAPATPLPTPIGAVHPALTLPSAVQARSEANRGTTGQDRGTNLRAGCARSAAGNGSTRRFLSDRGSQKDRIRGVRAHLDTPDRPAGLSRSYVRHGLHRRAEYHEQTADNSLPLMGVDHAPNVLLSPGADLLPKAVVSPCRVYIAVWIRLVAIVRWNDAEHGRRPRRMSAKSSRGAIAPQLELLRR